MPNVVVETNIGQESLPKAVAEGKAVMVPEMVPRNCKLKAYTPLPSVPSIKVSDEIIAYASPDSTFAVTKRLFDGAKKTILIGIYDFSAEHMKQLTLAAMRRGVKVEVMLDIDTDAEKKLLRELGRFGADWTPAPSCASKRSRFFRSSHEKVIVIDNEWCLVQSGNYSDNSIPFNPADGVDSQGFITGNRDMGLAVKSAPLAKFFRKVLEGDIKLELSGAAVAPDLGTLPETFLVERAPDRKLAKIFPSKKFSLTKSLSVQPVLSPENYMSVVPGFLATATKSVLIEQQYIRGSQKHIAKLLATIKKAKTANPGLNVRILLGKVFGQDDVPKEQANLDLLAQKYGLKLGSNIRFVDTSRLVHCHNKMIVIDGAGVLISSQNWSNAAVAENREAGLLLTHSGIARYFTEIFEIDWSTAKKEFGPRGPEIVGADAVQAGRFVRVVPADYTEV